MNDPIFRISAADVKKSRDNYSRITAGEHRGEPVNVSGYGREVIFSLRIKSPDGANVGHVFDLPIEGGDLAKVDDDHLFEARLSDFLVEYQEPSEIIWESPSVREILEAFADPDDMGEELPEQIVKQLDKADAENSQPRDRYTLDDVEIEFDQSSSGGRFNHGKTRLGVPLLRQVNKVTLKGGGWDRDSQLQRRMEKPTAERLSELAHKFEEVKEFAFERDQVQREAAERRKTAENEKKARVKTLRPSSRARPRPRSG